MSPMPLRIILALSVFLVWSAPARTCQEQVFFRLWQPDGETWYDAGEEIQIAPGETGHIYIHVAARGPNPYSTSATVGYPEEYGYRGNALEIERRVRMEQQNRDDIGQGRIRFRAGQTGRVQLGYRITGVASPGSLGNVAQACRVGTIPILVAPWEEEEEEERPAPPRRGSSRHEAAVGLVEILYEGILRRDDAGRIDGGFVNLVERKGLQGLEDVAVSIAKSPEFQTEALRRTQAEHGRIRDQDELINTLLWDIYGYLYGDNEPSDEDSDSDFDDLSACLSNGRYKQSACEAFGRSLIRNPLFEDDNSELVEELY